MDAKNLDLSKDAKLFEQVPEQKHTVRFYIYYSGVSPRYMNEIKFNGSRFYKFKEDIQNKNFSFEIKQNAFYFKDFIDKKTARKGMSVRPYDENIKTFLGQFYIQNLHIPNYLNEFEKLSYDALIEDEDSSNFFGNIGGALESSSKILIWGITGLTIYKVYDVFFPKKETRQ